jgi:hypothetical protein
MAYGSVKSDFLVYNTTTGDVTLTVSGINDGAALAAIVTGIVNTTTKNITTTGVISGYTYKTSGNVTVISGSGDVRPYGLYSFPTTTGTSGNTLTSNGDGTTSWVASAGGTYASLGQIVALN